MKTIKIVTLISTILFCAGCQKELNLKCLKAKGDQETRTLSFVDFTEISIEVPCELTLIQGTEYEVVIESTTNVIDRIERDSRLKGNDLDISVNGCTKLEREDVIITITLPMLEKLKIEGSSTVTSGDTLTVGDEFTVDIDGSGEVDLSIESTNEVTLKIDGSGFIDLTGSCDELVIQGDGSAYFNVDGLETKTAKIQTDGSGKVNCHITEEIEIDLQGSGMIEAQGQATRQDIKVDGSGKILNADLVADDTEVDIKGSAEIEVDCVNNLSVKIEGSGRVCYRGNPNITTVFIDGSGSIINCN